MNASAVTRDPVSFRLNSKLLNELRLQARRSNRSLNNYVESVLLDHVYSDPNDETIAAINEARSGKFMDKLDLSRFDDFLQTL